MKSCPFCRSDKIDVIESRFPRDEHYFCWMECWHCGAQGPVAASPVQAAALWHYRAGFPGENRFSFERIYAPKISRRSRHH